MAELADAHDSKSCGAIRAGSSPAIGSKIQITLSSLDFLHRKTLAIGGRKRSYVICKLEKTVYFRKIIRLIIIGKWCYNKKLRYGAIFLIFVKNN